MDKEKLKARRKARAAEKRAAAESTANATSGTVEAKEAVVTPASNQTNQQVIEAPPVKPKHSLFGKAKTVAAPKQKVVAKSNRFVWWKLCIGIALIAVGVLLGAIYLADTDQLFAGMMATVSVGGGMYLAYDSYKREDAGFIYKGKKATTGKENAILIFARHDSKTKKDVPLKIVFAYLENPPKEARLHLVLNLKKHFYILYNNTETKHLEPLMLPDKKPFPPELFKTPAMMQAFKDYLEYSAPSMLQKIAPLILIGTMVVVGVLMVMTAPAQLPKGGA